MGQYVPTKLTREVLDLLLGAPSKLVIAVYLLLCDLKANCPEVDGRPAGWLGSNRRLAAVYTERTGLATGHGKIAAATLWLQEHGILECARGPGNRTRFLLVCGTQEEPVDPNGNRYLSGPAPTGTRFGTYQVPGSVPIGHRPRMYREAGKQGSARERAFANPSNLQGQVAGGRAAAPFDALLAEAEARGVGESILISAAARSADPGRSVVTLDDVAALSARELERVHRYVINTHPLGGEEPPPPPRPARTGAKPPPDLLSKLSSGLFAVLGEAPALEGAELEAAKQRAKRGQS